MLTKTIGLAITRLLIPIRLPWYLLTRIGRAGMRLTLLTRLSLSALRLLSWECPRLRRRRVDSPDRLCRLVRILRLLVGVSPRRSLCGGLGRFRNRILGAVLHGFLDGLFDGILDRYFAGLGGHLRSSIFCYVLRGTFFGNGIILEHTRFINGLVDRRLIRGANGVCRQHGILGCLSGFSNVSALTGVVGGMFHWLGLRWLLGLPVVDPLRQPRVHIRVGKNLIPGLRMRCCELLESVRGNSRIREIYQVGS